MGEGYLLELEVCVQGCSYNFKIEWCTYIAFYIIFLSKFP